MTTKLAYQNDDTDIPLVDSFDTFESAKRFGLSCPLAAVVMESSEGGLVFAYVSGSYKSASAQRLERIVSDDWQMNEL